MEAFDLSKKYTLFPYQKKLRSQKTEKWKRECVDAVISYCLAYSCRRRSSLKDKRRNYNIFNNNISSLDFSYVTNPFPFPSDEFNQSLKLPASIQPLDILSSNFMLLIGEGQSRIFSPFVIATNYDAIKTKLTIKKNMLLSVLVENVSKFLSGNEESDEELLRKIEEVKNYNPKDIREVQANHLLKYLIKHERLEDVFFQGWKDALISGEEIYYVSEVAGAAKVRRVNPMEVHFVIPDNSNFIDEATMVYEINHMTVSEIIDEFYDQLTPEQISDLEKFERGEATSYNYGSITRDEFANILNKAQIDGEAPVTTRFGVPVTYDDFMSDYTGPNKIPVHRCTWKGMRKIGVLHYIDPDTNTEQQVIVDELFELDKNDKTIWVEWMWINEYYQGIRIGKDMYLNIDKKKNQFRSMDNLSKCKSGYVGTLYSADNSRNISLMDRLVPWLFYYLIIWYRTELLIASNYGKIATLDLSLIPDGWSVEKYMYFTVAMKFKFVDSYKESSKGPMKGVLNQSIHDGRVMDMDSSIAIQHNITLLEFIKQSMEDTCGITRHRKGQLVASDSVGGTERSVVQSSYITEPYFYIHNNTKLRAVDTLLRLAQSLIAEGSMSYAYVGDDMQSIFGTIDGREFSDADFEVFVSNSARDKEALTMMKQMLLQLLQSDKIMFSQAIDVLNTESIAELKNKIRIAENERMKMIQEQQMRAMEIEAQLRERENQLKERELDLREYEINLDNQTKLAIAEMRSLAIDAGSSTDAISGIADSTLKRLQLEQRKKEAEDKLRIDKEFKDKQNALNKKELLLKEKDINMRKEVEKLKLEQIREQNENQIELANKKADLDKEIMDKKLEIERMKLKNKKKSS